MSETQLYYQDGTPAGVYYCDTCKQVGTQDVAELCCRICECGQRLTRYFTMCDDCRNAHMLARYHEHKAVTFAAATKQCIDDYGGLVFVDDDRFMSLDGLEDYVNDSLSDFIADGGRPWEWTPPYVYATHTVQPMIDVGDAIDDALDDAYEGARHEVSAAAEADLTATVDAWSRAHLPTVYFQNENLALVPWPV